MWKTCGTLQTVKRGVKRKADTTTPVLVASSPGDPLYEPSPKVEKKIINSVSTPVMPGKIPAVRRESNRKIIKPKRDLPDEQVGEKVCLGFQTLEFQI